MSDKNPALHAVTSVASDTDRLDAKAHELDLRAALSNDIALEAVGLGFTEEEKFQILKRLKYDNLEDFGLLPVGAVFMLEKISTLSLAAALDILREFLVEHDGDVNISDHEYEFVQTLVLLETDHSNKEVVTGSSTDQVDEKDLIKTTVVLHPSDAESNSPQIYNWQLQVRVEAALIGFHSPYSEVRSVTDPYDDPNLPVETVRVYILGILWTVIGSVVNQFFAERKPSIGLGSLVVQLLLYPSGVALHYILPNRKFKVWNQEIDLNPGPWTFKEQMLTTIFYSVSGGTPYVSYNIHVQRLARFYDNKWAGWGYQILLILSTNFMGFGFAGVMRKFAVYPVKAIWPTLLPTLALNRALLQKDKKANINGWTISKYYFFFLFFAISFVYFWLPNYLFQALSTFNWMTWIAPDNFNLALITGSQYGLGLNPIPSFDWNVINFNSALILPWYTQVSHYTGSIVAFFCILGIYFSNYYWTAYLPINSSSLFLNKGKRYQVSSIVNEKSLFDQEKYDKVGPPFYSAANLIVYGSFFALYPFAIVYEVACSHKIMWNALRGLGNSMKNFRKSTFEGFKDPHTTMMRNYKEVADWVFIVVLFVAVVLAVVCVKVYPAETPVWGIFFALAINFVFLIPLTVLASVTGMSFGLNVLVELIVGYALPGNGLALNFIKALGYNIDGQAQNYISDQKMSHYMKLPPRAVFRVQMISVFITSFVSLAIMNFMIDTFKDYCEPDNKQKFTCPSSSVFYTASVLWGVIGPEKVFSGLYPVMQYAFLIGGLLAIPCVLFKKYGPPKLTKYFQPTIVIMGFLIYAPYNLSYYTGGMYVSYAFMVHIKKKYSTWWEKYNYVLAGALSAGTAFSALVIFFAVQYQEKTLDWWGNSVIDGGIEGSSGRLSLLNVTESAPDGYFGPRIGHYP